jgi:hypothetical protein
MNLIKKIGAGLTALILTSLVLTGCGDSDYTKRKEAQDTVTLEGESLEKANLAEKLRRENNPNAVRYVYLYLSGTDVPVPVGYFVIKGKVSSAGSQIGPEQEIICRYERAEGCQAVDSAQDDGTFGAGDPGIFFFTAEGAMVTTTLIPLESDTPLPIEAPELTPEDVQGK